LEWVVEQVAAGHEDTIKVAMEVWAVNLSPDVSRSSNEKEDQRRQSEQVFIHYMPWGMVVSWFSNRRTSDCTDLDNIPFRDDIRVPRARTLIWTNHLTQLIPNRIHGKDLLCWSLQTYEFHAHLSLAPLPAKGHDFARSLTKL
jgi:hypothetical protein